jgi:UDP-N-acetylmuramate--alanine ligase
MVRSVTEFQNPFFIGVAGSGMSAIAQYLKDIGKNVTGSDRFFMPGEYNETKEKLEAAGISCFVQDGSGIGPETDLVVVSTAVEDTVAEVRKARDLNIPIIRRAELLSVIAAGRKTIAVAGTSGKSTASAMLFDILEAAGLEPGIISGAGLVSLMKDGSIGNARAGKGDWLVIEADESDGSLVHYKPEIGLLLNIDKDHKEIESLMDIFSIFRDNSRKFIVNHSHPLARKLSKDIKLDFSTDESIAAGFVSRDFQQVGFSIQFYIGNTEFVIRSIGRHNMENALAATTVSIQIGVDPQTAARALKNYQGIYRRNQVLGNKQGVWVIDDYAHNPVKCAAAISACQPIAEKVVAWFQPHGYGPTKFLRQDFVKEISAVLRKQDEIWMSEIFYAGGTTTKDISANDLISDLKLTGANAYFIENRNDFIEAVRPHLNNNAVLLLMGARDPSLEQFAAKVWRDL